MTTLSAHVLDAALGVPAVGLGITLIDPEGGPRETATTDADGRVAFSHEVRPGAHAIVLSTRPWFAAQERSTFYPSVHVVFEVAADEPHYHVAVLLSPYAYTTYRGS